MATQAVPDAAMLKTWDEAFQYPLPTVRKLSARLRRDIDEHRARLRSLVGASYRDLLETAERIIDMDKQIQSVEHGLGDIGRRCNSSILERADSNYVQLERTWSQQGGEEARLRGAAQLKMLAAALGVVGRFIRTEGQPLQAAKLMVLTRLLYKSLSESNQPPAGLERYRRTIATLRNKLLEYIDRRIVGEDVSTDDLTTALSAYALLTSSAAKEVLKHFLAVRTAHLESVLIVPDVTAMLTSLQSYSATFLAVQIVFPKRLAEALSTLSKVTLLSDKHVKGIDELNLDIYGRWIPDDIRGFKPWVQQDNLSATEGRQAMVDYSSEARAVMLRGVEQCLENLSTIDAVLDLRKRVLGATLSMSIIVKTVDFEAQLEDYREAFASRLRDLIQQTVSSEDFTIEANASTTITSIWDLAQEDFDLSSGGMAFRQTVLRRRNGHDASFDTVLAPYRAWQSDVEKCWTSIETIKATKWEEYFEQDLEDGDDEDITPYQDMLSDKDAARLQKVLYASVQSAVKQMFARVEESAQGGEPQFFVRILRELHTEHLRLAGVIALPNAQELVTHDLSHKLHVQLADSIAAHGIEALQRSLSTRHYLPVDLWEGSPRLPLQPLPASFRYVMAIQQALASTGEDIWTDPALQVVKSAIQQKLVDILQTEIVIKPDAVNGDAKHSNTDREADQDNSETTEDKPASDAAEKDPAASQETETKSEVSALPDLSLDHVQRLFDALYLARVFGSEQLGVATDVLKTRAALQAKDVQRLEKNAAEYWKKTYLLLGLLARTDKSYSR